jgi:hypothetical protein
MTFQQVFAMSLNNGLFYDFTARGNESSTELRVINMSKCQSFT